MNSVPYYADDSLGAGMALIEPAYNPAVLQRMVSENDTLEACNDAMVTNIDLTGYIIEREEDTTPETDPGKDKLEEVLDEVVPGLRLNELRR